mgnify:CR=1 FL=1
MKFDSLKQTLAEREANGEFSGTVLLTKNGEELFAGAYGFANRPWQVRNTIDTRYETASLTKLIASVAVLQLIDKGQLRLDTAVIPLLGYDTPISDDVTVFHLLTHSSGIADDAEEEAGEDYADLWKTKPNYAVTELVDFLPNFIHKTPNFPPGTGVRYNNVGFVLLGLVLEKITGMRFRDYVQTHIFDAIGMTRSGFFHMADVHPEVAESYTAVTDENDTPIGWQRAIYMRPPIGSPDGGVYTTAPDMTKFMDALRNGKLLSPELTKAIFTPQVTYIERETYDLKYAFANLIVLDKEGNVLFTLGQGEDNGVSAKAVYYPEAEVTAVLLANQGFCTWPLVWEIHELISNAAS